MKRFIAPEIKRFIKRKLGLLDKNLQKDSFEELKKIPRYTKTKLQFKKGELIIPDSASFLFMQKEIFEQHIYKFQSENIKPYIIDGGANIGLATIYLKLLYPSSTILAFEPDAEIFNILKKNIESFNFKGVGLVQKGLWNEETTISFKSEGADAGFISTLDETVTATNSINVVSLKPYLNRTIDFLKLDIEGAETIVLKDIANDLGKVKRIFVEYHSFVGQVQTLNEIINILTKANFRIYMSIPGNNSLNSPLMGLKSYNNMDFQLNIFGYKEGNQ
ncbi:FkbM family methyltransferase [Salegentibacter sp. JZCK2]|uniref:FkbM family methyltransferase n=1 Tax=Salegentibacter tibetensis TaxID=2873600 RepID=UPI001CCCED4B|nr:FkbM family methyltransferase [Salegentibacter tibetensis]MBZ9729739.1 FkbM family methyltransferase [Salegentibacter tibetensis]